MKGVLRKIFSMIMCGAVAGGGNLSVNLNDTYGSPSELGKNWSK